MRFTVDESKWLHGEGYEDSYLLRKKDGKMCCVGFFCLAGGVKKAQISGVQAIESLRRRFDFPFPEKLTYVSQVMTDIYDVNDKEGLKLDTRRNQLRRLFKRIGHTIMFEKGTKRK